MNVLLVEAERVVNGSGSHFREYRHYRLIAEAVHAPRFREVVARSRPVRNWSVFHFFPMGPEEVINRGYFSDPPDFVPFLSGHGQLDFNIYADLADLVPFELMLGDTDRTNVNKTFGYWLSEASKSTTDLIRALDEFLAGMAKELGAVPRQTPPETHDEFAR